MSPVLGAAAGPAEPARERGLWWSIAGLVAGRFRRPQTRFLGAPKRPVWDRLSEADLLAGKGGSGSRFSSPIGWSKNRLLVGVRVGVRPHFWGGGRPAFLGSD
jgi:hypothetical protein